MVNRQIASLIVLAALSLPLAVHSRSRDQQDVPGPGSQSTTSQNSAQAGSQNTAVSQNATTRPSNDQTPASQTQPADRSEDNQSDNRANEVSVPVCRVQVVERPTQAVDYRGRGVQLSSTPPR